MRINGQDRTIERCSIREMLQRLELGERGIAVALNGVVIPRSQWQATIIEEEDSVEVVTAAAGG